MKLSRLSRLTIILVLTSMVAACGGGTAELKKELDERRKRQGTQPEALPQVKTYESFQYDPAGLRSPFQPKVIRSIPSNWWVRCAKRGVSTV